MLITPAIKDRVLTTIVNLFTLEKEKYVETSIVLEQIETYIDLQTLNAILLQFERLNLVLDPGAGEEFTRLKLRAESHDLIHKGGFSTQEEIFKQNIEKLCFEVEKLIQELGPNKLETTTKLSTIAATILQGLTALTIG